MAPRSKPVQELKLLSQPRPALDALALVKAMRVGDGAPCALLLHPDRARLKGPGTLQVPPLSDPRSWEPVAQLLDAQTQLWLPVVTSARVPDQVRRLYSLWREVGLEPTQLSAVGLMPDERIQSGSRACWDDFSRGKYAGCHGFAGSGDRVCPCIG